MDTKRTPEAKSRFAIPVAVAVAAHALLFFGFAPPKVIVQRSVDRESVLVDNHITDIVVDLAKPDPDPNAGASSGPQQRSAAPTQPDYIPDVVPVSAITVPVESAPVRSTDTSINVLPTGLTGVENVIGDGSATLSIFHRGDLDNIPRVTFQARPNYPFNLRSTGVSGEVVVDFMVDEQGRVSDVRVVRSSHSDFERPTVAAVEKWRFEPGKRHGRAVRFRMSQAVSFAVGD